MSSFPDPRLFAAINAHFATPEDVPALWEVCRALCAVRRDEQMLPWCEKGIALDPTSRVFVHARARALRHRGEHEAAVQTWRQYEALDWEAEFYRSRLGRDLYLSGETERAIGVLRETVAMTTNPVSVDARRARKWLAEALLSTGDAAGFEHWLHRNRGDAGNYLLADVPVWSGQRDLRGQRVFMTHQIGYGDQFMLFASVRHWLDAGAEIMLTCDPAIHDVVAASLPECKVLAASRPLRAPTPLPDEFLPAVQTFAPTLQATLLHLPQLVCRDATLPTPYFPAWMRAPDAERATAAAWASAQRAAHPGKRLVGLFWDCVQRHLMEHGSRERCWAAVRSVPVDDLERLVNAKNLAGDVQFVSLHRPDAELLAGTPRGGLTHYAPGLETFAATTACIETLDAVVSVDSGVANLSAMIGKPTAVLLNPAGEWRWGRSGPRSPWMDSVTLIRQTAMKEWTPVMDGAIDWLASQR
jgi:hypothetical protein